MTTTATHTDSLRVHRAVMQAVGPQGLAEIARPATDAEYAELEALQTDASRMTVTEFAAWAHVSPATAATMQQILIENPL